jgi:hypothetical protein
VRELREAAADPESPEDTADPDAAGGEAATPQVLQ